MLTEEQKRMAQQLMQMNPGMSPEEAINAVRSMPPGAMTGEGTRGITPPQQGPAMGQVPGDVPQVSPGLLGPGGNVGPRPQPQGGMSPADCAQLGGSVQGGACVIPIMGQR